MKKSRGDRDFFGVLEQRKALKVVDWKSQIISNHPILTDKNFTPTIGLLSAQHHVKGREKVYQKWS